MATKKSPGEKIGINMKPVKRKPQKKRTSKYGAGSGKRG